MTQEEINKIIVEKGEGGCWHEFDMPSNWHVCKKCGFNTSNFDVPIINERYNPDFSKWENFGRMIKIVNKHPNAKLAFHSINVLSYSDNEIDQIPTFISGELAMILGREK